MALGGVPRARLQCSWTLLYRNGARLLRLYYLEYITLTRPEQRIRPSARIAVCRRNVYPNNCHEPHVPKLQVQRRTGARLSARPLPGQGELRRGVDGLGAGQQEGGAEDHRSPRPRGLAGIEGHRADQGHQPRRIWSPSSPTGSSTTTAASSTTSRSPAFARQLGRQGIRPAPRAPCSSTMESRRGRSS